MGVVAFHCLAVIQLESTSENSARKRNQFGFPRGAKVVTKPQESIPWCF
jgi:hypothetical protein